MLGMQIRYSNTNLEGATHRIYSYARLDLLETSLSKSAVVALKMSILPFFKHSMNYSLR